MIEHFSDEYSLDKNDEREQLLDEAITMLNLFNTSIESGIHPAVNSPLQKTLHDIIERAGKTVSWVQVIIK